MTLKNCIPTTLVAGDGWAWLDATAFASHPPADWSLRYVLRPLAGGASVEIDAIAGADAYELRLSSAQSAVVPPGQFTWVALAFHGASGDRATLATGRVEVLPDPAASTGDQRSSAERILDAIKATLEGRVSKDAESYSIEGRSISRTPIADLLKLREVYTREVQAEQNPGASPFQIRRVKF
ncbi:hypothetical protein [Pelagimonas varians]|uniref:Uncharacterized protein n=1 Tax=Pelagimonas varians TaxID=696760 RepID=A0A238KH38_9RHOB|nr:hypothetical protein [Pelagimonas varians]PYG32410.1 hypothetical protein C8N36_103159 [Pelagimonas varians]SMX41412.1 hypothetical protein PEV8663_02271 [Pelagimonas varians]